MATNAPSGINNGTTGNPLAPNPNPGRAPLRFTNERYGRMLVGYSIPDPVTGQREEMWIRWILSMGTTPGGLLRKALVYVGPRTNKRIKQTELDFSTVPLEIIEPFSTSVDVVERLWRLLARQKWIRKFGEPKWYGKPYHGNETIHH